MAMQVLELTRGTAASWSIFVETKDSGQPYQGYSDGAGGATATPEAEIWAGDDSPVLLSPSCEWVSVADAEFTLTVSSAESALLEPGRYKIIFYARPVAPGADRVALTPAWLEITAGPGEEPPRRSYCSFDDMLLECSQLRRFQNESDSAGFSEQRGEARTWTDNLIQHSVRQLRHRGLYRRSPARFDWAGEPYELGDDTTLQQVLDDDGLVLTGPGGRRVVRANACYAIAMVYARQVGQEGDEVYGKRAEHFQRLAVEHIVGVRLAINAGASGSPWTVGPLGELAR